MGENDCLPHYYYNQWYEVHELVELLVDIKCKNIVGFIFALAYNDKYKSNVYIFCGSWRSCHNAPVDLKSAL